MTAATTTNEGAIASATGPGRPADRPPNSDPGGRVRPHALLTSVNSLKAQSNPYIRWGSDCSDCRRGARNNGGLYLIRSFGGLKASEIGIERLVSCGLRTCATPGRCMGSVTLAGQRIERVIPKVVWCRNASVTVAICWNAASFTRADAATKRRLLESVGRVGVLVMQLHSIVRRQRAASLKSTRQMRLCSTGETLARRTTRLCANTLG